MQEKLISATHNCPFFETTHQENHIKSSLLGKNLLNENRFLAVHMSGGTTEIVLVNKMNTTIMNLKLSVEQKI